MSEQLFIFRIFLITTISIEMFPYVSLLSLYQSYSSCENILISQLIFKKKTMSWPIQDEAKLSASDEGRK